MIGRTAQRRPLQLLAILPLLDTPTRDLRSAAAMAAAGPRGMTMAQAASTVSVTVCSTSTSTVLATVWSTSTRPLPARSTRCLRRHSRGDICATRSQSKAGLISDEFLQLIATSQSHTCSRNLDNNPLQISTTPLDWIDRSRTARSERIDEFLKGF